MNVIKEDKKNILKIINALKQGKVLVLATDTVYGLVCDADNKKALEKIFKIKQRDKSKPLLLFIDSIKSAKEIALIGKENEKLINSKWPGKVTFIFQEKNKLSKLISKDSTVGLRVPNYKFLLEVLKKFGKPLAQTSANISGKDATVKIGDVLNQFGNPTSPRLRGTRPDIIVDSGNLKKSKPSTIIDLTDNNKIIRQ